MLAGELGEGGMRAEVISHGAVLRSLTVPLDGGRRELTLGFADLADYLDPPDYFGSVCGRVANRIAQGQFECEGETFDLDRNEAGRHHLHGGAKGFSFQNWTMVEGADGRSLDLYLVSADGEGGYPGTLRATCRYAQEAVDTLTVEMTAEVDRPCPVNLTHHAYWNLDGGGPVARQRLKLAADAYLPTDPEQIPTGEIASVDGTVYDFREGRRIGDADPKLDHCFVTNGDGLRPVAELWSGDGRVRLKVESDQKGLQVYNGFKLGRTGRGGERFLPLGGLCLEPQGFPDAPNRPAFPSVILRPGRTYRQTMRLSFHLDG